MSFEVSGLEDVVAGFGRAASTIGARTRAVRDETKTAIKETAQEIVAVDEGELRDSIHETEEGVEATADHAEFVEWGTYKDAPQPFMDPAVDEHESSFIEGIAEAGADI
jgi:HK97 gp10 family phage protein